MQVGAGYDLWRDETVTEEGVGLHSSALWAGEAEAVLASLQADTKPWFLQVNICNYCQFP